MAKNEFRIEVHMLQTFANQVPDKKAAIANIIAGGIMYNASRIEVSIEKEDNKRYLVFACDGNPFDLATAFALQGESSLDESYRFLSTAFIVRTLGFFTSENEDYYFASRTKDSLIEAVNAFDKYGNFHYEKRKDIESWQHGSFTNYLKVRVDDAKTRFIGIPEYISKHFAMALINNPNLTIVWDGMEIEPAMHAKCVNDKEKLTTIFGFSKKIKTQPEFVDISDKLTKVLLPCPFINGTMEIIWQKADKGSKKSDTAGISVFQNGILLEHCGMSLLSTYDSPYKKIDDEIAQLNMYGIYVNLLPDKGTPIDYYVSTEKINWSKSKPKTKESHADMQGLLKYFDEVIGPIIRYEERIVIEKNHKSNIETMLDTFFSTDTNFRYIRKAIIPADKGETIIASVVLKVTGANEEKINKYDSLEQNKTYTLSAEDFPGRTVSDWDYLQIYEFKPYDEEFFTVKDIKEYIKIVDQIIKQFKCDKDLLVLNLKGGNKLPKTTSDYIEKLKSQGYRINYTKYDYDEYVTIAN